MIANLSGTPSRLCQVALTSTPATVYTAQPVGRSAILDISVCNTTGASITMRLCIGSISTATALIYDVSIAAHSLFQLEGFQILNISEALVASASASGLTMTISGLERV